MLKNAAQLRGATAAGVPNIRYVIAHIPHLLPARVMRDSSLSSTTRIRVGRPLTQINKPEHPSRIRLNPPTKHRETLWEQSLRDAQGRSGGCFERRDWCILYSLSWSFRVVISY